MLVTCCKFTRCSSLVEKSLVIVAEVNSLQNSLVTRCKSCLLQKITVYKIRSLFVAKVARWKSYSGTNVYIKPIKIAEFYWFILHLQLTKNRKTPYTMQLASQKYNASSSQLSRINFFNEKNIYYKSNNTNKSLLKFQ